MGDTITLTGVVATEPRHLVTSTRLAITSFRLASSQRHFDQAKNTWVEGDTNWYSISTFRQLALNVADSVRKGQHIVVVGKLRVRNWENAERKGTSVDVDADAIGHDLFWCTSTYAKSERGKAGRAADPGESFDSFEPPEPPEPSEYSDYSAPPRDMDPAPSVTADGDGFLPRESPPLAALDS